MLVAGYGEFPGALDGYPVGGVLAPIGLVIWLPVFRTSCALGPVGSGSYGDEVLGVVQVVGVEPFTFGCPGPGAAVVGVVQRHHVVDVQVPGVRDGDGGIGCKPLAGFDDTPLVSSEGGCDEALGHQHLVPGVLAVPVVVCPVFPLGSVVLGEVDGYRGYGYLQCCRFGCGNVRGGRCGRPGRRGWLWRGSWFRLRLCGCRCDLLNNWWGFCRGFRCGCSRLRGARRRVIGA